MQLKCAQVLFSKFSNGLNIFVNKFQYVSIETLKENSTLLVLATKIASSRMKCPRPHFAVVAQKVGNGSEVNEWQQVGKLIE